MKSYYRNIFKPIHIGQMQLKNRVALAPMGTRLGNRDDTMSDRMIEFYTRIAEGGTGLIITGVTAVSRNGTVATGMNSLYDDRHISGFTALAESIHKAGAKLAVHLMHAGMEAYPFYTRRKRLISPSDGIFGPNEIRFKGMDFPKTAMCSTAMTVDDIRIEVDNFASAALRAQKAGADAIEINGAQGFLLQQFYSPYFNRRTDNYGGSLANRMRFPLEVLHKIKSVVGEDFPVIFRMVATEGKGGAIHIEDAKEIAIMLEKAGVNALHITAGRGVSPAVWSLMMPIAEDGHIPVIDHIEAIKKTVNIPVIGVQRIVDPSTAEDILKKGKADIVALGRGLIADPDWVKKTAEGRPGDIRKCIGCLQGCIGTQMTAGFARCLQNPESGREKQMQIKKTDTIKRVMIIGGGPAGLEAALITGLRGHKVMVFEKEPLPGGQWNLASAPPGKRDFRWVVEWRTEQIARLQNVMVVTGHEATADTVKILSPDALVVATGSIPFIPDIPGSDSDHVVTAHDVLSGKVDTGNSVVVIGGGSTGCETANYLGYKGKKVSLIEATGAVGTGEEPARKVWLIQSLNEYGVKIYVNMKVLNITSTGIIVLHNEQEENIGLFDTIVIASGVRSYNPISEDIKGMVKEIYTVGDAYVMPTNGLDAIHHASEIARMI
ncbi:MAG: FAD-dependent oxidoreductase [Candidatus Eremiobacterota bacterium]